MGYRSLYIPAIGLVIIGFLFLLVLLLPLMILGIVGARLNQFGLGWFSYLVFLVVSLLGGAVNIPVWRRRLEMKSPAVRYVTFFGIRYPIPSVQTNMIETILSINIGGAILPLFLSFYLIARNPQALVPSAVCALLVTTVVFFVSKPVTGIGIVSPLFIPPIVAGVSAMIIGGFYTPVVAYVSGVVGTLIGADILHLGSLKRLGAGCMSIGGAGTFDGIFMTGILAVLLAF